MSEPMLFPPKDAARPVPQARQSGRTSPEFLVVSAERGVLKTLANAIRQVSGRLNCAPSISGAACYITRRKTDGIVVDMALPGALELIQRVRAGSANRTSVIFACMGAAMETHCALRAGANFVMHRPLLPDKIAHMFNVAAGMMAADKRRYYRHPLMVPVELNVNGRELESTMSNLSEGGMAMWSLHYHPPGSRVRFSFALPFGEEIQGTGEITWTNQEGLAGVRFNILPDQVYTQLSDWIAGREARPAA